ncbi:hypothetical protein FRB99_001222 [Tulasnella sp. 403]|nr:hypothetical protein FRB99_001222 [Tulasnella sp. 403]
MGGVGRIEYDMDVELHYKIEKLQAAVGCMTIQKKGTCPTPTLSIFGVLISPFREKVFAFEYDSWLQNSSISTYSLKDSNKLPISIMLQMLKLLFFRTNNANLVIDSKLETSLISHIPVLSRDVVLTHQLFKCVKVPAHSNGIQAIGPLSKGENPLSANCKVWTQLDMEDCIYMLLQQSSYERKPLLSLILAEIKDMFFQQGGVMLLSIKLYH